MTSEITEKTSGPEIAAIVSEQLRALGIDAVLSGGALVTLYSNGAYVSADVDLVSHGRLSAIAKALAPLGFTRRGQSPNFEHPRTKITVEFPPAPVAVGHELVRHFQTLRTKQGELVALTPTDAVKDRLAGFMHWTDPQNLEQARLIVRDCDVDAEDVIRWAKAEGATTDQIKDIKAILKK